MIYKRMDVQSDAQIYCDATHIAFVRLTNSGGQLTMAPQIKALPPMPPRPVSRDNVDALLDALEARNALLVDTLSGMCEAWRLLRGESPREVHEVIEACRAA